MGLFRKKEPVQNPNAQYYPPEGASIEWFNSAEGKKLFDKIQKEKGYDLWYMRMYWNAYITALPNIKAIEAQCGDNEKNATALVLLLSKFMAATALSKEEDAFGDTVFSEMANYDFLIDATQSGFTYYAQHVKFGMTGKVTKIVLSIIINNSLHVEEEPWLYDESIFGSDNEKEVLSKLSKLIDEKNYYVDINAPIFSYD